MTANLSIPFIGDVPSPSSEFAHLVPRKKKKNKSGFDMSMTGNSINRNETCCFAFVSGRFGSVLLILQHLRFP